MKIATLLAVLIIIKGSLAADDLSFLKAQAIRYRAAIKIACTLSPGVDCSQAIAKADEYAAAKLDYYAAAGAAMPILLNKATRIVIKAK